MEHKTLFIDIAGVLGGARMLLSTEYTATEMCRRVTLLHDKLVSAHMKEVNAIQPTLSRRPSPLLYFLSY